MDRVVRAEARELRPNDLQSLDFVDPGLLVAVQGGHGEHGGAVHAEGDAELGVRQESQLGQFCLNPMPFGLAPEDYVIEGVNLRQQLICEWPLALRYGRGGLAIKDRVVQVQDQEPRVLPRRVEHVDLRGLDGSLETLEVQVVPDHGARVGLLLRRRPLPQVVLAGGADEHEAAWLFECQRTQALTIPGRLASGSYDAHEPHLVMRDVELRVEALLQLSEGQGLPVRRREHHRDALCTPSGSELDLLGPAACGIALGRTRLCWLGGLHGRRGGHA
mmetsp:Transcript_18799/g.59643  ORF Transcript_18799/g.59643 Transcript_18799/m.59643 type:complete len:275 (+) Transcript_18799:267-1091(+)